jgi:hypothetical protein
MISSGVHRGMEAAYPEWDSIEYCPKGHREEHGARRQGKSYPGHRRVVTCKVIPIGTMQVNQRMPGKTDENESENTV